MNHISKSLSGRIFCLDIKLQWILAFIVSAVKKMEYTCQICLCSLFLHLQRKLIRPCVCIVDFHTIIWCQKFITRLMSEYTLLSVYRNGCHGYRGQTILIACCQNAHFERALQKNKLVSKALYNETVILSVSLRDLNMPVCLSLLERRHNKLYLGKGEGMDRWM